MAATDPAHIAPSVGEAPALATLLQWVRAQLPSRAVLPPLQPTAPMRPAERATPTTRAGGPNDRRARRPSSAGPIQAPELVYETCDWQAPEGQLAEAIYEPYSLQSLAIAGARPHPTALVQSAAMASVAPPKPCYRPHFPEQLIADGILSDAQLESIIYAGEAHMGHQI